MGKILRVPYKMLAAPVPIARLKHENTALLLMDFQRYTCSRDHGLGKIAVEKGIQPEFEEYYSQVEAALDNGSRLLDGCRKKGLQVVHTYLHGWAEDAKVSRQFREGKLELPVGYLQDEILPQFKPIQNEVMLARGTHSPFIQTRLEEVLHEGQVDTLIIAGMLFNYSVVTAAREAADLDYNVVVVWDASASETLDWHLVARTGLVGGLIVTRSTTEVLEMLDGRRT
jgi:nicotinamidase-related amidase